MIAFAGAVIGFVVGAVLATLVNLDLVGFARDAGAREAVRPMRWIMRTLLLIAPVGLAWIGYTQAETVYGGLK